MKKKKGVKSGFVNEFTIAIKATAVNERAFSNYSTKCRAGNSLEDFQARPGILLETGHVFLMTSLMTSLIVVELYI